MTARESPSDVRRKRAALLLVFTVFGIATAIDRLPVPAPQPVTLPAPPPYRDPGSIEIISSAYPGSGFPGPRGVERRESARVNAAPQPSLSPAAAPPLVAPTPVVEPPAPVVVEPVPAEAPLVARSLWFQADVPVLASAPAPVAPYGSGIGAAGHAVGRAFGIAGRQIATAFRRTGDAVKDAF